MKEILVMLKISFVGSFWLNHSEQVVWVILIRNRPNDYTLYNAKKLIHLEWP